MERGCLDKPDKEHGERERERVPFICVCKGIFRFRTAKRFTARVRVVASLGQLGRLSALTRGEFKRGIFGIRSHAATMQLIKFFLLSVLVFSERLFKKIR